MEVEGQYMEEGGNEPSLVVLILQCTKVASVWKLGNGIVWEVRLLIISWRSISRQCNMGSIKQGMSCCSGHQSLPSKSLAMLAT